MLPQALQECSYRGDRFLPEPRLLLVVLLRREEMRIGAWPILRCVHEALLEEFEGIDHLGMPDHDAPCSSPSCRSRTALIVE